MHPWLRRLRHDLVKRVVWTARDLRDTGAAPTEADVRSLKAGLRELVDPEGNPIDARSLWKLLRDEAPGELRADPSFEAAAAAFGTALDAADAAAGSLDRRNAEAALATFLGVETAFDALARSMNR